MLYNVKIYLKFPWNIAIVFGLMFGGYLFFDSIQNLSGHKALLTPSSLTSFKSSSSDSQYNRTLSFQDAFIKNAKDIGPAVVNISKVHDTSTINNLYEGLSKEKQSLFIFIESWLKNYFREKKYISETIGSGLIIDKSGYIVTNYHVIENIKKILIRLSDKRHFFAKVIGVDPLTDLAILKINSFRDFPYPSFNLSADAEVGQWVMTIGNPYGLQGSVTVGVVSGVARTDLGITTYENFIQTDASINPGNSGGPLIDLDGNIIGINTSGVAVGSGIGFSIPINMVMRIAEKLIESGDVERGWLGVGIQRVTPDLAIIFKVPSTQRGILVNTVKEHTPAKRGGMIQGDIVIQYNGKPIRSPQKFKHMVAETLVGTRVPIKIIRDGQEKTLLVTIGKLASL